MKLWHGQARTNGGWSSGRTAACSGQYGPDGRGDRLSVQWHSSWVYEDDFLWWLYQYLGGFHIKLFIAVKMLGTPIWTLNTKQLYYPLPAPFGCIPRPGIWTFNHVTLFLFGLMRRFCGAAHGCLLVCYMCVPISHVCELRIKRRNPLRLPRLFAFYKNSDTEFVLGWFYAHLGSIKISLWICLNSYAYGMFSVVLRCRLRCLLLFNLR